MKKPYPKIYGYVEILHFLKAAAIDLFKQGRPKTYCVLAVISSYSKQDGTCFPSITQIAKKLGVSRQAVSLHVRVLKEQKYLFIEHPQNGKNQKRTNLYRLNFKKIYATPASSITCDPQKGKELSPPARFRACPKKQNKKPKLRNNVKTWFKKQKKDWNNFFQHKERAAKLNITKQDEEELAELRELAMQGVPTVQRVLRDQEIQKAAKSSYDNPKDRFNFVLKTYKNIIKENS